jgi:hypothetical protein
MSIPDDLDDVVVKLLAKKPEERYQTADEVRELVTRCRKTLSESTARSIGLAIGRSMGGAGMQGPAQATPPSQPISSATPYAGTPTPMELQPPSPPADRTVIKESGAQAQAARPEPKRLPAEMVAATQAVPEGAKFKGEPSGSSRGMMLGVAGLALGGVALAVAFVTRQPAPATQPPPMRVEAPKPPPEPAPLPEPVKAEAPKPAEPVPAPKPEPVKEAARPKVDAPKPEPKAALVAAAPKAKGDKLLARFLALEKQSAAKPEALPSVDRTILGKYLDAIRGGTIKPEQREQAEVFANKIEAELKGQ